MFLKPCLKSIQQNIRYIANDILKDLGMNLMKFISNLNLNLIRYSIYPRTGKGEISLDINVDNCFLRFDFPKK